MTIVLPAISHTGVCCLNRFDDSQASTLRSNRATGHVRAAHTAVQLQQCAARARTQPGTKTSENTHDFYSEKTMENASTDGLKRKVDDIADPTEEEPVRNPFAPTSHLGGAIGRFLAAHRVRPAGSTPGLSNTDAHARVLVVDRRGGGDAGGNRWTGSPRVVLMRLRCSGGCARARGYLLADRSTTPGAQ
jgi:hypothetical protein